MCALMSAATHSKKKRLEGLLSGQDLLQSEWSNALRELLAVWAGGGSEWAGSFFFEWGGFLVSCSCCLCRLLVQACARSPSSSSPAPFSQIIMSCGSLTRTRFRSQMKPLSLLSPNINSKSEHHWSDACHLSCGEQVFERVDSWLQSIKRPVGMLE